MKRISPEEYIRELQKEGLKQEQVKRIIIYYPYYEHFYLTLTALLLATLAITALIILMTKK